MNIWILTTEYNQYDQYGEYYVKTFARKPNKESLLSLGVTECYIEHVLSGGGRKGDEDQWFHLREIYLND
jgi:hypothetical protein